MDWSAVSAISASIAVIISVIVMIWQRKDIRKQSKYQRNTFELQNRINSDNITFNLAGDIIGNIQTQEQTVRMLYQEVNVLSELNNKLSMNQVFRNNDSYVQEIKYIKKEIEKSKESIKKFNNYRKDLTNEFTSKSNSLQFHMSGEGSIKEVEKIFSSIVYSIEFMVRKSDNLSDSKFLNRKELDVVLTKFKNEIYSEVKRLQDLMKQVKLESLNRLEKLQ
ncbi:hypothetical protein LMG8526HA_02185 [Lactococcus lactis]|uniref:hypothetical protein n=1 Tax=Lactococcus lactis TaxID=1358 RepID=UPI00071CBBC2|nr:hypothetical protein [Lactococcus lactis]KSU12531.1 hypothetical protein LMG8526_0512 [Lactococcus lactis subsp. lactis]MDU0401297.1 hypothetical protein [Lactococcus lactis]